MASGDMKLSNHVATGTVTGTGSNITIPCGFKPKSVWLYNVTGEAMLHWNDIMPDAYGYKGNGLATGTNAAEAAHTHAVALDGGASAAEAAHTHAVALDTGTSDTENAHTHAVALDTGVSDATSGGTPAGTNGTSSVNAEYQVDSNSCTEPVIALTHNADPVTNLNAAALYGLENGAGDVSLVTLQSTTNGNADVLGETADGVGGGVAASCRFFVKDNNSPAGVQIYVNEGSSDRLEFISPTTTDGFIIMPFETAAGGIPGACVRVRVYHNATADSGKALYFDDNGAADAQLVFVDTGAAGGVIPAGDIAVLVPSYSTIAGKIGVANAQTFSGAALATHTHGPGTLADAASGAGSAHGHGPGSLADAASGAGSSHTHGPGTLADAASAAGSSHNHVFTGGASDVAYITSLGVTPLYNGFTIGADTDVNVVAEELQWVAIK